MARRGSSGLESQLILGWLRQEDPKFKPSLGGLTTRSKDGKAGAVARTCSKP